MTINKQKSGILFISKNPKMNKWEKKTSKILEIPIVK